MIHESFGNEKAKISIFKLNGRAAIWWEHVKQVKGIKEKRINYNKFENISSENIFHNGTMTTRENNSMS